jgi:hypothetical protein
MVTNPIFDVSRFVFLKLPRAKGKMDIFGGHKNVQFWRVKIGQFWGVKNVQFWGVKNVQFWGVKKGYRRPLTININFLFSNEIFSARKSFKRIRWIL